MDLALSEAQQMLKQMVDDFVRRESWRTDAYQIPQTELGYSEAVWRKIADLGWLGMVTPERYGGTSSTLLDTAVVFEGLGYGPVYGPYFSSGVLSPLILQESGSEEQQQKFLPGLAHGDLVCTLASSEADLAWGPEGVSVRAEPTSGGYRLSGTKLFVHDAHCADYLIVTARASDNPGSDDGVSLFIVDATTPGVSTRRMPGFMSSESEVRFDDAAVPDAALLGTVGSGWSSLEAAVLKAIPILCAYAVGGQQACFDLAVEYSRTRTQFNQPIGRFQHVQDHIIQLVNYLDSSRWMTWEAIWRLDASISWPEISVHAAKAVTSDAYVHVTDYAHEVLAGNGTVAEMGLTMYTRLSRSLYALLGDPTYHKRRLGDLLVERDGSGSG